VLGQPASLSLSLLQGEVTLLVRDVRAIGAIDPLDGVSEVRRVEFRRAGF
jgi:hypothetical protein